MGNVQGTTGNENVGEEGLAEGLLVLAVRVGGSRVETFDVAAQDAKGFPPLGQAMLVLVAVVQ